MSRSTNQSDGDVVRELLSVADLLEEPRLARVYACVARRGPTTVRELMDELGLAQGTAYADVDRLVDAGVLEPVSDDGRPRSYVAREIDLTVVAADGTHEYTVTPALVDAVGRRAVDEDIDTYIDRHGIPGLATALSYAVDRQRGETTHRSMARDLDVSPLAAEIVLQALAPVVSEHFDVEGSGASVDGIEGVDADVGDSSVGDSSVGDSGDA